MEELYNKKRLLPNEKGGITFGEFYNMLIHDAMEEEKTHTDPFSVCSPFLCCSFAFLLATYTRGPLKQHILLIELLFPFRLRNGYCWATIEWRVLPVGALKRNRRVCGNILFTELYQVLFQGLDAPFVPAPLNTPSSYRTATAPLERLKILVQVGAITLLLCTFLSSILFRCNTLPKMDPNTLQVYFLH